MSTEFQQHSNSYAQLTANMSQCVAKWATSDELKCARCFANDSCKLLSNPTVRRPTI